MGQKDKKDRHFPSTLRFVTETTLGGGSTSELQTINLSNLSSGTFRLTFDGQATLADHVSPRSDESDAIDDNGNRTGVSYTTGTNNRTTADATY